jgi:tRNA (Thr-GGU) A37 N-methylase
VHLVKLLKMEADGSLEVRGLEAVDGTPVVDLKPVLADERACF